MALFNTTVMHITSYFQTNQFTTSTNSLLTWLDKKTSAESGLRQAQEMLFFFSWNLEVYANISEIIIVGCTKGIVSSNNYV